ncbi:hypothetical protein VNO78_02730 [Psophocarpus tetragonolobus]|uniref:BZIP domain-containing protein n=1 Tax=Psophocarpus tetragonolobus TaxID=3891 RepID=A0AAN9SZ46_PSOTE
MEENEGCRNPGPPNYATLTQQQQHGTYVSSTLHNETIESHNRDPILTHVDSSQVLNSIPFYYCKLHLSNNVNTSSPNTSSNSTNDNNADDHEAKAIIEDRKKKRMFSNRESARRSRMRKKQQIESLQCHLDHLQTLNRQLSEKIIYLLECNQQILQHNAQLKDKVSSLQVTLSELLGPLGHVEHQHHHFPSGFVAEPSSASEFHQSLASSGA